MASYTRGANEVVVGITTLIVTAAFCGLFLYSTNRSMTSKRSELHLRLPAADGLQKGDAVLYRGVTVGTVKSIEFERNDVLVSMMLTQPVPVTRHASAGMVPTDIFGRQSIVIHDGVGGAPLTSADTLYGDPPSTLVTHFSELGRQAGHLLSDTSVDLMQGALRGAGDAGVQVAALAGTMHTIAVQQSAQIGAAAENIAAVTAQLREAMSAAKTRDVTDRVAATTENLARASARMDSASVVLLRVLNKLDAGTGSAGRLLNDDALYTETRGTMENARSLIADIKAHPRRYINLSVF